ncbi:proton-conducting transporter membrane subunit [Thioalkalivibrio sulfidiphilus]|uniref:proton-conducting transporter transmembrane domain-containing protein n=1 Tax=Thioalkalivibrio sulfidiphilus TaxID=1033854 RepID=UPI001E36AB6F|nr:proton-conducting transporter membrane subunit [Thioalkalivibrio sulfidiphilus]
MDEVARAFLLPSALIWCLAGWFAASRRGLSSSPVFAGCWLLALAGNLSLILAAELLVFYFGFALMTFAAYGLVVHQGSPQALNAGRWYLFMMFLGELCLFTAVALLAVAAGAATALGLASYHGLTLGLFAVGFAIKLGLVGVHTWLPRAHPVAPVPASAVLSGVMIKTGILGWWRVSEPHGPLLSDWGPWLMFLGIVTVFYGIASGLNSREPKTVLAWSSVSQMGLAALLAGLALTSPGAGHLAWLGIAWLVLHHGLAKAALFLGAGLFQDSQGKARGWIGLLLCLPALALAGAPFTSGWFAKAALDAAVIEAGQGAWLPWLLTAGAVGTTLLMARFLHSLWVTPEADGLPTRGPWLPWGFSIVCVLALPWTAWVPEHVRDMANGPLALLSALWPVVLGLALYMALFTRPATAIRWPWRPRAFGPRAAIPALLPGLVHVERRMHRWSVVGTLFMFVIALLLAALSLRISGPVA